MPYPSEHSARLRSPGDFKEKPDWSKEGKFRRTSGGTIYGKIAVPKTIGIIWGQLKSQSGQTAAPQSLRFPTHHWSVEEAKNWLRTHKVKYIGFEPAEKTTEEAGTITIPASALIFSSPRNVEFAQTIKDEDTLRKPIQIIARTNAGIETFMGTLYHELSGVFHKPSIPLDWRHDPDELVGVGNSFLVTNDALSIVGEIISLKPHDRAYQIIQLADSGVPFEASINWGGQGIEIERLKSTESKACVNGAEVHGPAMIVRKWPLRGLAICPYGADNKTGCKLSLENLTVPLIGEDKMSNEEVIVAENVEEFPQHIEDIEASPQRVEDIKESARPAVLSPDGHTAADFMATFGREFGALAFADGKSFDATQGEYINSLKARVAELEATLSSIRAKMGEAEGVSGGEVVTPSKQQHSAEMAVGPNLAKYVADTKIK